MKKSGFILFLLVFAFSVPAQDAGFLKKARKMILDKEQYAEAVQLITENSKSFDKLSHDDAILCSYYLALGYVGLGNFIDGEKAFLLEISLAERFYGKHSAAYGSAISDAAWGYFAHGQPAKALRYYEEYYQLSKTLQLTDQERAVLYENLAKTYQLLGDNKNAENFYTRSMEIYRHSLGTNHPYYLMFITNLADFYSQAGKDKKADALFGEAAQKLSGMKRPPQYINYLVNDFARYGLKTGNYMLAEQYFDMLYQVQTYDPYLRYSKIYDLLTLAKYYCLKKDYDKAANLTNIVNQFYHSQMNNNALLLNEDMRESFWRELEPVYSLFNTIAIRNPSPGLAQICYNNQLTNKAILLNSNLKIKEFIQSSQNVDLLEKYHRYISVRQEIVDSLQLIQPKNLAALTNYKNTLETEILQSVPVEMQVRKNILWDDIKKHLKEGEAAIEFVCFDEQDMSRQDNTYYIALLIRKDSQYPELIRLCEQRQLVSLLKDVRTDAPETIKALYDSTDLYNLLWKPLESYLTGITRIYFSTSGLLNNISFQSMSDETNYLKNRYDLYQLSSTRIIAEDKTDQPVVRKNAVIFGQMDYGKGYHTNINDTIETEAFISQCNANNIPVKSYFGTTATEKMFKQTDGYSPSILSVSTHGLYIPVNSIREYSWLHQDSLVQEKYPMLRSVLIFSGANEYWKSGKIVENGNNNILQAQEIAGMDLSNTDLVILSACESALGDINNYEGVFGLQRAFKLAGCNTLVMTFWNVPVRSTQLFMEEFYKSLLSGKKTKHEAFRAAQEKLKGYSVYDWGGFVMID